MRDFICPTAEQHLALEDVVCTKFVGALVFSREKDSPSPWLRGPLSAAQSHKL
jgi:hypothetical protein